MKKFTLLQSAFALIAAFMLALPARAQVASAADLFGTYKFAADGKANAFGWRRFACARLVFREV